MLQSAFALLLLFFFFLPLCVTAVVLLLFVCFVFFFRMYSLRLERHFIAASCATVWHVVGGAWQLTHAAALIFSIAFVVLIFYCKCVNVAM